MNERGALTTAEGEDKIAEAIQFAGGRRVGTGKDKEASEGGGSGNKKKSAKMKRRQSKKRRKARMQEVRIPTDTERRPKRHKRSPSVNFHEWQQARDKAGHVSSERTKTTKNVCSGKDPGKVLADHIYNTIYPPEPPEKLTVLVEMQGLPAPSSVRRKRSSAPESSGAMLIISELKTQLLEERARREAAEAKFQAISVALGEMATKVARIVEGVPAPKRPVQSPELHN